MPYAVEFRDDDHDRRTLVAAHGFVRDVHASHVCLQRRLEALASPAVVPYGFTIWSLAGVAAGFSQAHTIWRQEAGAADVC